MSEEQAPYTSGPPEERKAAKPPSVVIPFPAAGGGFTFTCSGCGHTVYTPETDGFAVCIVCRWLGERPALPAKVRDQIRGFLQPGGSGF